MLSNFSIGTRIGLLVVGSLLTVALLGGTATIGAKRIFEASATLNEYRELYERTAGVERRAARLRFQALRFVTERDSAAAEQFDRNAVEINKLLGEIRETATGLIGSEQLDRLSSGVVTLKDGFAPVVEKATELGLTEEQGLRNALRTSAKSIEDELKQWPGADKLIGKMESMRKMEKDFIIYSDEALLSGLRKAFNEFTFFLSDSGMDQPTQDKLEKAARTYRSDLGKLVDATKAFRANVQAFNDAFQALGPSFDALLDSAASGMTDATETQNTVRDEVVRNVLMIGSVLLGLFLVISLLVARSITAPLRSIEGVMERLAAGDEAAHVPGTKRKDEIGSMARAVQVFKDNLQRTHELEAQARESERRAEEERKSALQEVAKDFDHAFGRVLDTVGSAADQIRAGAYILRDTAEKMRVQALDTAEKAEQTSEVVGIVNDVSRTLTTSIGEIGTRVNTTGSAVQKAVEHARQSDSAVQALADSSQRIGEIVRLISTIAGQTNLLALNATIEAARAGEAGRGFAVVANEVKTLANQTALATQEISGQVSAIQQATTHVVDAIRSIRSTIEEVDGLSQEVSVAVSQQLEQTQAIVQAVSRATDTSHEVSDNVATMAQTAAETGKSAIEMIFSAGQLSEEFKQLESDADRFVQSISV